MMPSTSENPIVHLVRGVLLVARDFCKTTSMHGFNHIAASRRHWVERILWIGITAAAIWGALDISLGQFQRYNDSPTVVTLEKDFRTWQFSLPAITACYLNKVDASKLPSVIKNTWDVEVDNEKYEYYKRFVHVVANSNLFHLQDFQEFKDDQNLEVDLYQLAVKVMPDMDLKATWSEGPDLPWTPVMTEAGACFSINSLAIADIAIVKPNPNDTQSSVQTCKYASLICYVILEIKDPCDFYIHSGWDVPDATQAPSRVILTMNRVTAYTVMETATGKGVKDLSVRRRGCVYTDEPVQSGRRVYSTNTCRLSCRNQLAMKLCGCKPFYYFYDEGPPCSVSGMACLAPHAAALASNAGERCSCGQQCVDASYKELSTDDQYWEKGPFMSRGLFRCTVQAPRTRYTREIVFHFQDLVVSFGGAAGLFLGASFISFVEILYFLLERIFRVIVVEEPKKASKPANGQMKPEFSYETSRINHLNRILADQKRYEYDNKNQVKW